MEGGVLRVKPLGVSRIQCKTLEVLCPTETRPTAPWETNIAYPRHTTVLSFYGCDREQPCRKLKHVWNDTGRVSGKVRQKIWSSELYHRDLELSVRHGTLV